MKKDYKDTNFNHGIYKVGNVSGSNIPFSKLYFSKNIGLKYGITAIAGVLFAALSLFLIKNTGGFGYGLSSLLQGINKFISYFIYRSGVKAETAQLIYSIMFWCLTLVANIPLFIFSWRKIGHRFTLLTLVFLLVNTGTGLLLELIPDISNVYLFGDTTLYVFPNLPTGYTSWITELSDMGIKIIPFSIPEALRLYTYEGITYTVYESANYVKPLFLLFALVVYAFAGSFVFALLYVVGGCTAGTDFVSVFLSAKKGMNVSKPFFIINVCCITIGSIMGCYIPAALEVSQCCSYQFFLSSNLICTIVSLLIFTLLFKKIFYPRGNKYRVEIFSKNIDDIKSKLYADNYVHASSLITFKGGYKHKNVPSMMTICSTLELPLLLDIIITTDKDAIVDVTDVTIYRGSFASHQMGSDK